MHGDASPPKGQRDHTVDSAVVSSQEHFARRVQAFAVARALVFTATGLVCLLLFWRSLGFVGFGYSPRSIIGIVGVAWLSSVLQYWAGKRLWRVSATAMALLVVDQLLFTGIIYLTGGVASGATSLLGLSSLVGGLLFGVAGAILAVAVGAVFFAVLFLLAQVAPFLLPPDQAMYAQSASDQQSAYYFVFTMLMLLLVGLLAGYLAERLARAGGEVAAAQARAEQAEHLALLGKMAAGLAHEIRNPLGSISGSVQMLRDGTRSEEDRELFGIVLREVGRLEELVSDLLDLSRSRPMEPETISVGQLVNDVVLLSQRSGRGAGDVAVTAEGDSTAVVRVDVARTRQLLWNLVRNAIQASPNGGRVRVLMQESAEHRVLLVVEDDGVGIPPERLPHLFEAFYTTRTQGTGLGLAVVKRIADEHGFAIRVESDRGRGARFVVDLGPRLLADEI